MPLEPREIAKKRKRNGRDFQNRDKAFGCEVDFRNEYGTDDIVLEKIFMARAQKTSARCDCGRPQTSFKRVPGKRAFKCPCGSSPLIFPLAGTPFERLKIPLIMIPIVFFEMFCDKHGFTATEIDRRFSDKVKKNETSHLLLERISQAMGIAILQRKFRPNSIIEVDEVYPKVETGLGEYYNFRRGLGSERIQPVIVLIERNPDGTAGLTKAIVVDEVNNESLRKIFREHTLPSNTIYTDGSKVYNFLKFDDEFKNYFKQECNHNRREWVVDGAHVNTVEGCNSYIKTTIHRVYKGIKRPNTQLYVNRVAFNFSFGFEPAISAMEILFGALPPLDTRIKDRVICRRTEKKVEKMQMENKQPKIVDVKKKGGNGWSEAA